LDTFKTATVVLDGSIVLPEGARVRVDVVSDEPAEKAMAATREQLNQLRRRVSALPVQNAADGFSNRDHAGSSWSD
jgi:hypothetical protein